MCIRDRDKEGRLVAKDMNAYSNQGAYASHGHAIAANGLTAWRLQYACPNIRGEAYTCLLYTSRCLSCSKVCENCVDVCPNRANISIKVPGMEMSQVIHVDYMCNECGNCKTFCPYASAPYKDKFTLFAKPEDMEDLSLIHI